jgi:hypothetical protein
MHKIISNKPRNEICGKVCEAAMFNLTDVFLTGR